MPEMIGRQPDAVIACVGGGSNAMGIFYPYIEDEKVRLIGVEAAGEGISTGKHAASLSAGTPGVLHGNRTYLLQDANGQIIETHSVSAGLDYPGVGPEHAWLKDTRRAEYVSITDDEALKALQRPVPARRHHPRAGIGARGGLRRQDRALDAEGQGAAGQPLRPRRQGHADGRRPHGHQALMSRIAGRFAELKAAGRKALIPYITAGDPQQASTVPLMHALVEAGSDILEIGVPFSDPMADGPAIQRASRTRAEERRSGSRMYWAWWSSSERKTRKRRSC